MLTNETYFVWWIDSQYGPRATIIGNTAPEKVNEITQAFWACIKTVGINRMVAVAKPPTPTTEAQALWWLERMRVTHNQLTAIKNNRSIKGFVETPAARRIAADGLPLALQYGLEVKQVLRDLNPQNEALKTPLISSDLSIYYQLTAVAKLKEELGV
jgi:hypothetical protein